MNEIHLPKPSGKQVMSDMFGEQDECYKFNSIELFAVQNTINHFISIVFKYT